MKLRIGSGLPNIQKKDLAKFKITIPNISEQKVISAFLSSFERKADVEMNFVNLLLEEKQYLLRQMFIWTFGEANKSSVAGRIARFSFPNQSFAPILTDGDQLVFVSRLMVSQLECCKAPHKKGKALHFLPISFVCDRRNFWIQRKVQDILAVSSPLYENKCTLDWQCQSRGCKLNCVSKE